MPLVVKYYSGHEIRMDYESPRYNTQDPVTMDSPYIRKERSWLPLRTALKETQLNVSYNCNVNLVSQMSEFTSDRCSDEA